MGSICVVLARQLSDYRRTLGSGQLPKFWAEVIAGRRRVIGGRRRVIGGGRRRGHGSSQVAGGDIASLYEIRDLLCIHYATNTIHYVHNITLPPLQFASLHSNSNDVQELHRLQSRSIAGSQAPVLLCMPVRLVLLQGLSEGRLEAAAQESLQASQRGARSHARDT
jgi:hypothetical protein